MTHRNVLIENCQESQHNNLTFSMATMDMQLPLCLLKTFPSIIKDLAEIKINAKYISKLTMKSYRAHQSGIFIVNNHNLYIRPNRQLMTGEI